MNNHPTPRRISAGLWVLVALCAILGMAVFQEAETIGRLRSENAALRTQPPPAPAKAQPALTKGGTALDKEREEEKLELIELRGEVGRLRAQLAALRTAPTTAGATSATGVGLPVATTAGAPAVPQIPTYRDGIIRQWAAAAMKGDASALEQMANLIKSMKDLSTEDQNAARLDIVQSFQELGTAAGGGDTAALQALWQATRITHLKGFAVNGLGQAAGMGNQEALEALLHPENYLLMKSTAVGALKPAADAGNAQAIQALVAVTADPKQKPLWYMAASGLESAAIAGNAAAIDALAVLAADENTSVNKKAVFALEAAARGKQTRAEEALRKLGWR